VCNARRIVLGTASSPLLCWQKILEYLTCGLGPKVEEATTNQYSKGKPCERHVLHFSYINNHKQIIICKKEKRKQVHMRVAMLQPKVV
jgi:hypothetical protein